MHGLIFQAGLLKFLIIRLYKSASKNSPAYPECCSMCANYQYQRSRLSCISLPALAPCKVQNIILNHSTNIQSPKSASTIFKNLQYPTILLEHYSSRRQGLLWSPGPLIMGHRVSVIRLLSCGTMSQSQSWRQILSTIKSGLKTCLFDKAYHQALAMLLQVFTAVGFM